MRNGRTRARDERSVDAGYAGVEARPPKAPNSHKGRPRSCACAVSAAAKKPAPIRAENFIESPVMSESPAISAKRAWYQQQISGQIGPVESMLTHRQATFK